jgi:hypothetical protein
VLDADQTEQMGDRMRSVGDLNGDGFDDLAAGAQLRTYSALPAGYSTGTCPTNTRSRAGAVYIWLGSASGIGAQPDFVIFGEEALKHLDWNEADAQRKVRSFHY